MQSLNDVAYYL